MRLVLVEHLLNHFFLTIEHTHSISSSFLSPYLEQSGPGIVYKLKKLELRIMKKT